MRKIIFLSLILFAMIPVVANAGPFAGIGLQSIAVQFSPSGIIAATGIQWSDGTYIAWSDGTIVVEN